MKCDQLLDPFGWALCAHGNAVLGVMAAAHNDQGVAGLAPRCKYRVVKAFDDYGLTTDSLLAASLRWAADSLNVDIIANSWGVPTGYSVPLVREALHEIRAAGVAVFFAAGNDGYILDPAWDSSVFAVGATDDSDMVWSYSGKGPALDFVAPSGDIELDGDIWTWDLMGWHGFVTQHIPALWCEWDSNYVCRGGGTSLAAPQAAGVAALVLSRRPDFKNAADPAGLLFDILRNSAEDKGPPGRDDSYGWGRINAYRALCSVIRGDINNDGIYTLPDVVGVVDAAFRGTNPGWWGLPDLNCDGNPAVQDVVMIVNIVFRGGSLPPPCYTNLPSGS